jgi:hypothetical protein
MKSPTSFRLLSFVALSLFLLSACDSSGPNDEPEINNEFSFTITPTSSSSATSPPSKETHKELNGVSFFVDTDDVEDVQEQAFAIYLSGGESSSQSNIAQGLFGFIGRQSTQPEQGEYALADLSGTLSPTDFTGAIYEDAQNIGTAEGAPYYLLRSGTLNLEESNDNVVSGTLTATATQFSIANSGTDFEVTEQAVEITGEFTAKSLDTYVPVDQYTSPSGQ